MDNQKQQQETRQYWDEQAEIFDNEPDHGLYDPLIRQAWTTLLANWLPSSPALILDIGCGTGSLSGVLAALKHKVTGIDLSEAMLAQAQAKAEAAGQSISFKTMDAFEPDFPKHSFDVIVCRHLLWALPDPALALQRWSDILTTDGRILLIEGYWQTDAGLHASQVVEALPATFATATVKNLSNETHLWGKAIRDERYIVIAEQSIK